MTKVYTGEFVDGETGETEEINTTSAEKLVKRLRDLKDGDSLVVNCQTQDVTTRW